MIVIAVPKVAPFAGAANLKSSPKKRSFLTDIRIDYGPPEELGRLFLSLDEDLHRHGLTMSFGTFGELVDVNAANRDSWKSKLFPVFDPKLSDLDDGTAFCLLVRDASGTVVATNAVRRFSWLDTTLKQEIESLRWFYRDPEREKLPGEACIVTAPSGDVITGITAFPGAAWYRPDYRGQRLHEVVGKAAKAIALTRWFPDSIFALMAEKGLSSGFAAKVGYRQAERSVELQNTPWGSVTLVLFWSSIEQLMQEHLFPAANDTFDTKVDTLIERRT